MTPFQKFKRIVRDPDICGGQPTIKGTRVLVVDLLDWIKEGNSFEEILENFSTIILEDIKEIINYDKVMIAGEIVTYGSDTSKVSP